MHKKNILYLIVFATALFFNAHIAYGAATIGSPYDTGYVSYPTWIDVVGDYAYITSYISNNLVIVDISNPTNPATVSNWSPGTSILREGRSVEVVGNYAYITSDATNGFLIVDVSDPINPTLTGQLTGMVLRPWAATVVGNYAYIVGFSSHSMAVVDVSDPFNPVSVGSITPGTSILAQPEFITVSGNYAYIGNQALGNLAIIDVTDPTNPTVAGNWSDEGVMSASWEVAVIGDYAYVAGYLSDNVAVIDVTNPTNPTLVGNWAPNDANIMSGARSVQVIGDSHIAVTGFFSNNVVILDISDPVNPVLAENWDPNNVSIMEGSWALDLKDGYVYMAGSISNSLVVLDVSEYSTPPLEDTTIQNPDPTKIQNTVNDGYITTTGDITNTTQATTNVNVTLTNNGKEVTFPQNTTIQETNTNPFNFQNFTLESQNIKNEQPESRSAFRLGIEGTNLTFSQFVTITTFVGEAFNTQTLDILYQNEGETTWNTQGTCTVENGQCTFQTNHATIYTINGTLQSTGDTPLNINTEVLDTLTMDCYESTNGSGTYDVLLGTTTAPGYVTAGTPAVGQSTCTVTTNDDQGYYLTVEDDNGISSSVLTHTDPNTGTIYEIQDLTPWNDTTLTTENWTTPTTKGLGFSVITFPDTDTSNNIFDGIWTETGNCPEGINPDSNDYAGFPDTPQTIAAVPQYTANHTTTNICYKVDVPASQPSGIYTGSVTYTATSDASSYLN
jgi:hypothetical protein